ncbi:MAG: hypothetical protein EOO60_02870 [Hymenobacter sp.]|nr:MAG: hypothetical protein EOO60_02870 [Hymenobacter sp.]
MLYFPILRSKKGELSALESLAAPIKEVIRPVLQVPPPDLARDGSPVAPSSKHVQKMASNLQLALQPAAGLSCFLDPSPAGFSLTLLEELLTAVAYYGGSPQPLYQLSGSQPYARLYQRLIGRPHTALLRVTLNDANARLSATVSAALTQYGLQADQTLLLLDMGDISEANLPLRLYESTFSMAIGLTAGLNLAGYVVTSCALPATLPETMVKWVPKQFVRHEVTVFRHIKADSGEDIHFGDYALGNVITGPAPSRTGSPKLRYTLATEYEVVKGQKTDNPPNTMSEQYHRLSRHAVSHPGYSGPAFSWGDDYIHKASQPGPASTSRGSLATWVTVHTSHHLELVVSMLPAM